MKNFYAKPLSLFSLELVALFDNEGIVAFDLEKNLIDEYIGNWIDFRIAPLKIAKIIADFDNEISSYLEGELKIFRIPISSLALISKDTRYEEIQNIAYGNTITYSQLGGRIYAGASPRAAGSFCGRNSLLIIVPCHRVVAKNSLGGYKLGGTIKEKLLNLECRNSLRL